MDIYVDSYEDSKEIKSITAYVCMADLKDIRRGLVAKASDNESNVKIHVRDEDNGKPEFTSFVSGNIAEISIPSNLNLDDLDELSQYPARSLGFSVDSTTSLPIGNLINSEIYVNFR